MAYKIVSYDQIKLLRNNPEEFAETIVAVLNILGNDKYIREVAEYLSQRTHRTSQQTTMRLVINLIKSWALMYQERNFDLRNEATCRICAEIEKHFPDGDLYVPLV